MGCGSVRPHERDRIRRRRGSQPLQRAAVTDGLLRRPGRHAMPGHRDRGDRRLSARVERQPRRPLRYEPPQRRVARTRTRAGGGVPRLRSGRGDLRTEHDDAQLHADADARPDAHRGRRDPRDAARPRREHLTVARARARSRLAGRLRRAARRHDASISPISSAASPIAHVSLRSRWHRMRSARSPMRRPSSSLRTMQARSPGPTQCTSVRTARSTSRSSTSTFSSARRTSSSGRISASHTVAATCSSRGARTRFARPIRPARQPLRDRHARARAARRVRCSGRLHRLDRLDGDPGARARARAAVHGAPARQREALRPSVHRRPRADLRLHRRGAHTARRRRAPRRARHRRLGRQLLRGRGDGAARARRRRSRSRRFRALQHGSRGQPAHRRICASCEAPDPRRNEVPRPPCRGRRACRGARRDDLHARPDEPRPVPGGRAPAGRP